MAVYRIVSIDPSMANTGYWVGDVDEAEPQQTKHRSTWTDQTGMETHHLITEVARGTICTTNAQPFWERIQDCVDGIKAIVQQYKPQLLCSEGILSHGHGRNPSGTAVLALILDQFRDRPHPFPENLHLPEVVVTITPPKLFSIAHWGRKTPQGAKITKAVIKNRYRDVRAIQNKKGVRLTDHEADAYFCAYHASRFYLTLVRNLWPTSILTSKERQAFLQSVGQNPRTKVQRSTALLDEVRNHWWTLPGMPTGEPKQTQTCGSEGCA